MDIIKHWYRSSYTWLTCLLLPLSLLFRIVVATRHWLYERDILKSHYFSVPVIVVGNITVGGTGKTPFVIWLAHFLQAQGFIPGIVSRGYSGEKSNQPRRVTVESDTEVVGDEAVLLARRANCPVVVATDRVAAVKTLLAETDCNVVISDDGLQHYRLGRQIEIAIVDGAKRHGNQCLLPAGPLREPVSRLATVDFIVTQQSMGKGEYQMALQGDDLLSVTESNQKIPLSHFKDKTVHAVAAIGDPRRFFTKLQNAGLNVITHVFPDHYHYRKKDFEFNDALPVIMTEKDAVKCKKFAKDCFWYLPITVEMGEAFKKALMEKLLQETVCTF